MEVITAGRRRLKRPPGRSPLILPSGQVRRMREKHPTLLILTRTLEPAAYEVQDEGTVKENVKRRRRGRPDLQDDPVVFMIEVAPMVRIVRLAELEARMVKGAGFKTLDEFHVEWLERRGHLLPGVELRIYPFEITARPRYLHVQVHRGYTHDPAEAVRDEPAVIDQDQLEVYSSSARRRYEHQHAAELRADRARSLSIRLRDAHKRGDPDELTRIRQELLELEAEMRAA
jgi:hypothetical protein